MNENRLTKKMFNYIAKLKCTTGWMVETRKGAKKFGMTEELFNNRENIRRLIDNARYPEDRPKPRSKRVWTEEQRRAVGEEMRKFWEGRKKKTDQKPGNFADPFNKLDPTVRCALRSQLVGHWPLLQFNSRPVVKLLASHLGETGSIPGGVAPGFLASGNRAGRCLWSADFLEDLPFPPPLHSSTTPFSPHFTLIEALKTPLLRATQFTELNSTGKQKSQVVSVSGLASRLQPDGVPLQVSTTPRMGQQPALDAGYEEVKAACDSRHTVSGVYPRAYTLLPVSGIASLTQACEIWKPHGQFSWGTRNGAAKNLLKIGGIWPTLGLSVCNEIQRGEVTFWLTMTPKLRAVNDLPRQVGKPASERARIQFSGSETYFSSGCATENASTHKSTQKTIAPFEFRAGLKIEMKFISNHRNWRFEISIRDQQPSAKQETVDNVRIDTYQITNLQNIGFVISDTALLKLSLIEEEEYTGKLWDGAVGLVLGRSIPLNAEDIDLEASLEWALGPGVQIQSRAHLRWTSMGTP
ncbi:hypothetical protein PR048_022989 [Dryococelus australis]|uniref:Uncharacterized protein n=1 Tax=Dryococelus australis TaxID=614101 RepID=A0ABQ9GSV2_9NEOP|nr:hypothetical protein PR048_022989 [Dryococelus australis]